jgi:hypothetical protein
MEKSSAFNPSHGATDTLEIVPPARASRKIHAAIKSSLRTAKHPNVLSRVLLASGVM